MSINGLNINQRNSDFKSNSCCTLVPFLNHADHSYDFSPTCTSLSSITIIRAPLSLTSTKHNTTALIIEENTARPRNSCYNCYYTYHPCYRYHNYVQFFQLFSCLSGHARTLFCFDGVIRDFLVQRKHLQTQLKFQFSTILVQEHRTNSFLTNQISRLLQYLNKKWLILLVAESV